MKNTTIKISIFDIILTFFSLLMKCCFALLVRCSFFLLFQYVIRRSVYDIMITIAGPRKNTESLTLNPFVWSKSVAFIKNKLLIPSPLYIQQESIKATALLCLEYLNIHIGLTIPAQRSTDMRAMLELETTGKSTATPRTINIRLSSVPRDIIFLPLNK